MIATKLLATCAAVVALAGCSGQTIAAPESTPSQSPTSSMPMESHSPMGTPTTMAAHGTYLDYATYSANPAMYANSTVVLFFHASWCPDCKATNTSLTTAEVPAGLTVVKVDYDSMGDLKRKYGVTQQHTFVKIDASGKLVSKWTGTLTGAAIKDKAMA